MRELQIGTEHRGVLSYLGARAAFDARDASSAIQRLEDAAASLDELGPNSRRKGAQLAARLGRFDLAATFFDGTEPPDLAVRNSRYEAWALRTSSREVVMHAELGAWLGRPLGSGPAPESRLLAAFQVRLERLGRLTGEARAKRRPSFDPQHEFRETLVFLERAEDDEHPAFDRWRLDEVMDGIVGKMVDTSAVLGVDTLVRLTEEIDSLLTEGAGRLCRPSVRRAYAVAVFRYEGDAKRAVQRLSYQPGGENTPDDQLAEAARTASALVAIGLPDRARAILSEMHDGGLGYARAAKKDPQYAVWGDLLARACVEDPIARPDRLRFFGRLLSGMEKTEGSGAGHRLASVFLDQAAQAGAAWARGAADRIEELRFASWLELVAGLLTGVIKSRSDLVAAAGVIFGRIGLPFGGERGASMYPQLIRAAPSEQIEPVVRHAMTCLETDAHPGKRIIFLMDPSRPPPIVAFNMGPRPFLDGEPSFQHQGREAVPRIPSFSFAPLKTCAASWTRSAKEVTTGTQGVHFNTWHRAATTRRSRPSSIATSCSTSTRALSPPWPAPRSRPGGNAMRTFSHAWKRLQRMREAGAADGLVMPSCATTSSTFC